MTRIPFVVKVFCVSFEFVLKFNAETTGVDSKVKTFDLEYDALVVAVGAQTNNMYVTASHFYSSPSPIISVFFC